MMAKNGVRLCIFNSSFHTTSTLKKLYEYSKHSKMRNGFRGIVNERKLGDSPVSKYKAIDSCPHTAAHA
jgi:hypothetical protein